MITGLNHLFRLMLLLIWVTVVELWLIQKDCWSELHLQLYSPSGAYAGNSFAIPVTIVKKVVDDLKEYGEVQRAIIGVNIKDVDSEDAEKQNLKEVKGVLITRYY